MRDLPPWIQALRAFVRVLVLVISVIAGISLITMMGITCTDVLLRWFGHPLPGAFDLVTILGAVTMACALPYTTAVKGHVAVEYFFQKLPKRARSVVDALNRIVGLLLFGTICVQSVRYGLDRHAAGAVSQTLQIPIFWIPFVIAACTAVVMLVMICHLLTPGRAVLKP